MFTHLIWVWLLCSPHNINSWDRVWSTTLGVSEYMLFWQNKNYEYPRVCTLLICKAINNHEHVRMRILFWVLVSGPGRRVRGVYKRRSYRGRPGRGMVGSGAWSSQHSYEVMWGIMSPYIGGWGGGAVGLLGPTVWRKIVVCCPPDCVLYNRWSKRCETPCTTTLSGQ